MRSARLRSWLPLGLGAVALLLGVMAWFPSTDTQAADHRDGPLFANSAAAGTRDINDIYIFQSPTNQNNSVLVMTVNPFSGVLTPTTFDSTVFFDFKIDNTGDAREDLTFRVSFGPANQQGVQPVTVRGLPSFRMPNRGLLVRGLTGQNLPVAGGGMFRAANQDDPFFLDGFALTQLVTDPATATFPRPVGQAKNFFGPNANTLAMTLEVPSSLLNNGANTNIGLWGRTEKNGVQQDRMGRPGINTVLIPPMPRTNLARGDRRTAFNTSIPADDVRNFRSDMISVLTTFFGRTEADSAAISGILLPDILTFDTANAGGFLNGRRLRDDVIDAELSILTNGAITTDNVPDDNGTRITDGEQGTTAAFPYIGAPNDPPAGPNP